MAVSPISSVSFRNNYNQVNFNGRQKDDSHTSSRVSNTLKSIPLATVIAMSPLNSVDVAAQVRPGSVARTEVVKGVKNPNLIKAERLNNVLKDPEGIKPVDLIVQHYDGDRDKSTAEELFLYSPITKEYSITHPELKPGRYDINSAVKGINNFELKIVGDDGKLMGTYSQSQIELQDKKSLSHPKIIQYFADFLSSDENNTNISVKKVSKTLLPAGDFGLSGRKNLDTSWIDKVKQNNHFWGIILNTGVLSTKEHDYQFTFYSSDNNDDDVEAIVVDRSDGVRFKLDGLKKLTINNETNDGYRDTFVIGCINVSWPNVGKFTVFDNELYGSLLELVKDKNIGKSISVTSSERNIKILSDGNIMKLDD